MSRRIERAYGRRNGQGGFSLVEVVVAVGLLVVVLVAVLPEMVVGIRATSAAKNLSQAKGVLQARLEVMRSMPYHVGPAAGHYVDLLDTYYRDMAAPTTTAVCTVGALVGTPVDGWSGYLPATSTARCAYEPPAGKAFYRKVIPNITAAGLGTFTLVVDSAFLNAEVPPVALPPDTGYTSQAAGPDMPKSGLLGVWATIVYQQSSKLKPVSTYTAIAQRSPVESSLEVNATVNTVRVVSNVPVPSLSQPSLLTLDTGVVAQSGALFAGSSVHVNANAASAGSSFGVSHDGARATLSAPGSASFSAGVNAWDLTADCQYVCVNSSRVDGASVSAVDGLPWSASPGAPVQVTVTGSKWPGYTGSKYGGFGFNNAPDAAGAGHTRGLRADAPMVTFDANDPGASANASFAQSGCGSTTTSQPANFLSATGFLTADPVSDTSPKVWSCVTARTAPVMLFPTTWAPEGVIRVTLGQSSLQCKVIRTGGVRSATATANFAAKVEYWNGSSYVTAANITQATTLDPLASPTLLTQTVHPGLTLGDFIKSWSTTTAGNVSVSGSGTAVRAKIPGVVTIDSQPTREGDPSSVVSITVGTFTCDVKDIR